MRAVFKKDPASISVGLRKAQIEEVLQPLCSASLSAGPRSRCALYAGARGGGAVCDVIQVKSRTRALAMEKSV